MTGSLSMQEKLRPLFKPRSVAIIGASSTPFKHGNVATRYLIAGGFAGKIYPINPGGGEIEGLKAYKSILDVPGTIDCALFLIPAVLTVSAMADCARKGVGAVIIGSNGFADLGNDEGWARQRELIDIARAHNIAILGPNTNGIWNAGHSLSLGYNTSHGDPTTPGPVSIVAHSGAMMNSIAPALRSFGSCLSKYIPVGNEADIDMLDVLEYLIGDEDTRVIGMIVESIADANRMRDLSARACAAGKPIIALKLGRSKAGAAAALAHASRLAGSARAYEAFFKNCGILQVTGIEALAGTCALLSEGRPVKPQGDTGLVGVSTSGGGAELLADHAEDHHIPLAGNADGTWGYQASRVIETFAEAGLVRNPVDGGNLGGLGNLDTLLQGIERDGHTGPVVFFAHMLPQEFRDQMVADALIARRARTGSPVVCIAPGGVRETISKFYARNRVPLFHDTRTCFESLSCYYDALAYVPDDPDIAPMQAQQRAYVQDRLDGAAPAILLTELQSSEILAAAGVKMVTSTPVSGLADALARLQDLKGPVVLKGITQGIAHKNDAGLVKPGLRDHDALEHAWNGMQKSLTARGVKAHDCTFILQPMLESRLEIIAGVSYEPPLGHFLVAGLGGLLAEALDDVLLFAMPSSRQTIMKELRGSRVGRILNQLDKNSDKPDHILENLLDTLDALQRLVMAFPHQILSIDINPLLAGDDHCTAVDALIELFQHAPGGD